ncbi:MAG: hypothetical protein IJ091_09605, partial [Oscillospiraceae bacterium]|nr:hypothetical protein [Oscillospiraceae bacterium]
MTLLDANATSIGFLGCWSMIIVVLSAYSLLRSITLRKGILSSVLSGIRFAAVFFVSQLTSIAGLQTIGKILAGMDEAALLLLKRIPAWWIVLCLTVLTVLEILEIYLTGANLKKEISAGSIKEATDKMPRGILNYLKNGRVILMNPAMQNIVREIIGDVEIRDGNAIWRKIDEENRNLFGEESDTPILMTEDESKAYLFRKAEHDVESVPVTEVLAYDVTEAYAVSRRLMEENDRLAEQRDRLMELGQLVDSVTREREMLEAKVRIHDELGSLLIATKRFLISENKTGKRALQEMWKTNLALLQGKEREHASDEFGPVLKAAEDVGVHVEVRGEYPKEKEIRELLVLALGETITNTFRHAEGDRIDFDIEETDGTYRCSLRNYGKAPESPIIERGGLKHLRELVENYGGAMELEYGSGVALKLYFP